VEDEEHFLSRWSRRKLAAKEIPAAQVAADAPPASESTAPTMHAGEPAPPAAAPAAAKELSPEYREFFDPRVEEQLRRSSLKKLFSEPQFNVMDGLDTYIDDYSKPDPIPQAMLRQLNQAKELLLFDDEKHEAGGADTEAAAAEAAPALPESIADTSTLPLLAAERAPDDGASTGFDAATTPAKKAGING